MTLFHLHASTLCNSTFVTRIKNECMLWHLRLGHIGEKGLKTILDKKIVNGIFYYSIGESDLCEHCVFGKQIRSPFPKGVNKTKRLLEIIHLDVCGLVDVDSLNQNKYHYQAFVTKPPPWSHV